MKCDFIEIGPQRGGLCVKYGINVVCIAQYSIRLLVAVSFMSFTFIGSNLLTLSHQSLFDSAWAVALPD